MEMSRLATLRWAGSAPNHTAHTLLKTRRNAKDRRERPDDCGIALLKCFLEKCTLLKLTCGALAACSLRWHLVSLCSTESLKSSSYLKSSSLLEFLPKICSTANIKFQMNQGLNFRTGLEYTLAIFQATATQQNFNNLWTRTCLEEKTRYTNLSNLEIPLEQMDLICFGNCLTLTLKRVSRHQTRWSTLSLTIDK